MSYEVKITYKAPETTPEMIGDPIAPMFFPENSYTDSEAYEGTIYDTNVPGWGSMPLVEPYASTSIPFPAALAQFKLAVVGENNEVTFTVDSYEDAFYYKEIGYKLADQGFSVEVTESDPT